MRDPSPAIKRQKLDTNQESLVLGESESSAYNARVFRKIQKHLAADPDVDILSLLPTGYSDRLAEKKKRQAPGWTPSELPKKLVSTNNEIETDNDPFGPLLTDTIPAPIIVYPLSESVHSIILAKGGGNTIPPSSKELLQVLENSEIIWQSKGGRGHAIVKCNAEIVVKVVPKVAWLIDRLWDKHIT
ncbi:hypothetical protein MMC06_005842 [Schaereria dolodes]|nr:hypothetical protein [Schaereria dolodes]